MQRTFQVRLSIKEESKTPTLIWVEYLGVHLADALHAYLENTDNHLGDYSTQSLEIEVLETYQLVDDLSTGSVIS